MKEPIKVGDLVMVVKWPCCGGELGKIFKVEFIWDDCKLCQCLHCGVTTFKTALVAGIPDEIGAYTEWLRRIDPPAEQSTTDTPAELFA